MDISKRAKLIVIITVLFVCAARAQTHFVYTANTGNNATIGIPLSANPTIGNVPLSNGDEIGAFTSAGLCAGAVVWKDTNAVLTVWGDNDQTVTVDGMATGEQIYYRIWQRSTNIEYDVVNATYSQGDGKYGADKIFVLASLGAQIHFIFTANTGNNATIGIPISANPTIGGIPISNGDEIGAFTPAGLCAGGVVWKDTNAALTVWGDNDQTVIVDGMATGEQIYYRIWQRSTNIEYDVVNATYSQGDGTYSADKIFVLASLTKTSPLSPSNLTGIAGNGQMTLTWNKNTEADFLKYRIYKGTTSGGETLSDSTSGGITDTTKTITGLTNGTVYYFKVTAIDSERLESTSSNEVYAAPFSILTGEYATDANTLLLFHMDETSGTTVTDASGNANNGTANGTTIVGGRFGNGRSLNGTSDYISTSTLYTSPNPFTVELWFNTTTTNGGKLIGFGDTQRGQSSSVDRHIYMTNSGQLDFGVYVGSDVEIQSPVSYNDGKWHHVAASLSNLGMMMYVDGCLVAQNTRITSAQSFSGYWKIGYDNLYIWPNQPTSYFFQGIVDEIRISSKARLPQEFDLQLPPINLSASVSKTTVHLSWQNGGGIAPLMRYNIYRGTDSTNVSIIDSTVNLNESNLIPSAGTYFYRISAVDSSGFESVAAKMTIIITPPGAPQNLTTAASSGQVILKWNKNTEGDFLKYRIYKGTTSGGEILSDSTSGGITDTTKTITGLTNGTVYYFKVTAIDSERFESASSNEVNIIPFNVNKLEYATDANTLLLFHMDETSGTTVTDASGNANNGTANGTTIVGGRFGNGRSLNGTSDCISTSNNFTNPNTFTIELWFKTTTTNGGMLIGFGNSRSGQSSNYDRNVYMTNSGQIDFGVNPSSPSVIQSPASYNDGKWHHAAASLSRLGMALYVDGCLVAQNTGVTSAQSFSGYWKIGYDNLSGWPDQPASNYFQGIIDEIRISNKARMPQEFDLQLPPINLSASVSKTTVHLIWQNGGGLAPLMRYNIYRGTDSANVSIIDSTANLFESNSIPTIGIYYYRISAVDSSGFEGINSLAAKATIIITLPNAPQDLKAIIGNSQVMLIWSKNIEADFLKYRIYKGTTMGGETLVDSSSASISDTTKTLSGLTNGATYYFEVTAMDSARLESGFSNEVSATPVVPPPAPSLLLPVNGASNESTVPTLVWSSVSGAAQYDLQIATDSTSTDSITFRDTITDTTRIVARLAVGRTYFWRISSNTGISVGPFSPYARFTVSRLAPVGDYTDDGKVRLEDVASFIKAWQKKDTLIGDIGPATGIAPNFHTIYDGKIDFEDLMVLAQMYDWSMAVYPPSFAIATKSFPEINSYIAIECERLSDDKKIDASYMVKLQGVKDAGALEITVFFDPQRTQVDTLTPADRLAGCLTLKHIDNSKGFASFLVTSTDTSKAWTNGNEYLTLVARGKAKTGKDSLHVMVKTISAQTFISTIARASVAVDLPVQVPTTFVLLQNYPNPFNPSTCYQLSDSKRLQGQLEGV